MEFVCYVWISEQIANFALQNIKRLIPYTTQIRIVSQRLIQFTVRPKYAAAVAAAGVVVPMLHTSDFNAHNVT
jgi:hypothetical protein